MTDNSSKPLSVMDWIRLTPREIRALGFDPEDRIHFTGHPSHLPEAYVPSIGNWALLDTDDMINRRAPHLGLVPVKYGAFRQFRHARGLMTRSEFEAYHGPIEHRPWVLAELAWAAHSRAQEVLREVNGTPGSLGQACARAATDAAHRDTPRSLRFGLLPVEVVLWARIFDLLLRDSYLSYDEWLELSHDAKDDFWTQSRAGSTSIDDIGRAAARRELGFYTELAATG